MLQAVWATVRQYVKSDEMGWDDGKPVVRVDIVSLDWLKKHAGKRKAEY